MNKSGIYLIRNKVNGKMYVGSAVYLNGRWSTHLWALKRKQHHSKHLQRAYDKYGLDNLQFEVIEEVDNVNDLIEREQYWIDHYQSYMPGIGYNICTIAGSRLGVKFTDETKRKLSEMRKGITKSLEHRRNISKAHIGKTMPEYRREHLRRIKLGQKQSPEHVIKAKEARKLVVDSISEHHKQSISAANKGTNNKGSKLNEQQVREIKQLINKGEYTQERIAKMYGVSPTAIYKIKNGIKWAHVI